MNVSTFIYSNHYLEQLLPKYFKQAYITHLSHSESYQKHIQAIPKFTHQNESIPFLDINNGIVTLGKDTINDMHQLEHYLMQFKPWRKGPYAINNLKIDSEWDCRKKWDRIAPYLENLDGQSVLDIGSNSGYYLFRSHEQGADHILGIDPHPLYFKQFLVLNQWNPSPNINMLPIGYEHLPQIQKQFDYVFLMGILYHERNPLQCLQSTKSALKKSGTLVVESIVIDGKSDEVLFPVNRYAQMKNVYFIPTISALTNWILKSGFKTVDLVSVSTTDSSEQRSTNWSSEKSLVDFLDPRDSSKTIEGYPAPKRAILIAKQ